MIMCVNPVLPLTGCAVRMSVLMQKYGFIFVCVRGDFYSNVQKYLLKYSNRTFGMQSMSYRD